MCLARLMSDLFSFVLVFQFQLGWARVRSLKEVIKNYKKIAAFSFLFPQASRLPSKKNNNCGSPIFLFIPSKPSPLPRRKKKLWVAWQNGAVWLGMWPQKKRENKPAGGSGTRAGLEDEWATIQYADRLGPRASFLDRKPSNVDACVSLSFVANSSYSWLYYTFSPIFLGLCFRSF